MAKKYFLIILFLIIFVFPIYKIHAEPTTTTDETVGAEVESKTTSFIARFGEFIKGHTPEFIKQSITAATNVTEEFRKDLAEKLESKKTDLRLQIKAFDHQEKSKDTISLKDRLLKLLKYIELFFTIIFAIIFNSILLFYGISFIIIAFFVRFIGRRLF